MRIEDEENVLLLDLGNKAHLIRDEVEFPIEKLYRIFLIFKPCSGAASDFFQRSIEIVGWEIQRRWAVADAEAQQKRHDDVLGLSKTSLKQAFCFSTVMAAIAALAMAAAWRSSNSHESEVQKLQSEVHELRRAVDELKHSSSLLSTSPKPSQESPEKAAEPTLSSPVPVKTATDKVEARNPELPPLPPTHKADEK